MSDVVDPFEEPVLTPEAELVLREIELATAAAGFPIEGYAKLNAVSETLVGPDHAPINLGPTVELAVPIAGDGAPLPPPGQRARHESAAAIMIIRVAPERSFGVLCWRAWVNLVEVSTARAFFSQQSAKADEHWDAVAAVSLPLGDGSVDLDSQLDDAIAGITASLPQTAGEAVSQAFSAGTEDGRLTVGRDWEPPIKRLRFVDSGPSEDEANSPQPDDQPEPPEPDTESRVSWSSSFALVGVAATVGLVVGLALLWIGGNANAGTAPAHRPLLGQLLTGTSEDGAQYDRVLAFQFNDEHYPVTLFKTLDADLSCSAQHVHLATIETMARSFEHPDQGIYNPDPAGCGFGLLEALMPAPYAIPHEQLHAFCDTYHRETPDWLNTPTTGLCESRAPDAAH